MNMTMTNMNSLIDWLDVHKVSILRYPGAPDTDGYFALQWRFQDIRLTVTGRTGKDTLTDMIQEAIQKHNSYEELLNG